MKRNLPKFQRKLTCVWYRRIKNTFFLDFEQEKPLVCCINVLNFNSDKLFDYYYHVT